MKIRVWFIIIDGQDGSAGLKCFKNMKDRDAASEREIEECGMDPLDEGYFVVDTDGGYEVV